MLLNTLKVICENKTVLITKAEFNSNLQSIEQFYIWICFWKSQIMSESKILLKDEQFLINAEKTWKNAPLNFTKKPKDLWFSFFFFFLTQ